MGSHVERSRVRLAALLVAAFCANGALGVQSVLIPPFVSSLGGTASTVGLAYGIFSGVLTMWLIPFAWIARKLQARVVYTVAAVIVAAGCLLCVAASTPAALVLYRLVQALGGPYIFMLASEVPRWFSSRQTAFGMALFSVVMGTSHLIPSVAAGHIAAAAGYRTAFAVSGVLAAVPILALPIGLEQGRSVVQSPRGEGLLSVIGTPNILVVCAAMFAPLLTYHSVFSLVPVQVLEMGFPEHQIGLIFGTASIGYSLIQLPAGALSDAHGRKWLVVLKALLPPLVLLSLAHLPYITSVPIAPLTVGLALIAGLGMGIGTPAMYAMVVESAPSEGDASTAVSVLFTALMAPGLLMPSIGRLADLRGFADAFTITSAAGLTGVLIAALFLKETLDNQRLDEE